MLTPVAVAWLGLSLVTTLQLLLWAAVRAAHQEHRARVRAERELARVTAEKRALMRYVENLEMGIDLLGGDVEHGVAPELAEAAHVLAVANG